MQYILNWNPLFNSDLVLVTVFVNGVSVYGHFTRPLSQNTSLWTTNKDNVYI